MKKEKPLVLKRSMQLYQKALKHLPGGVSSNARMWHRACPTFGPCTIFLKKAFGSQIWDVDGNQYTDYRLGFGPVILGHSYPAVHKAVHKADEKGVIFAFDNELEITVAEKIERAVPCSEMTRFSVTGTEATMTAVRLARAYTKKEKIIKFEGHYHGHHDYVLFSTHPTTDELGKTIKPLASSLGIPRAIRDLVIVERWNDFDAIEKNVKKNYKQTAAIITEPIMGNASAITPKDGYLKFLKELCDDYGMLLIFDEVKTGFRIAYGGAQEYYKVIPHLATFAKAIANGYPISLVTGQREIMDLIGPKGVVHGGTYASNPVSLAAANATLDILKKRKVYKHLEWYGSSMMKGLKRIFDDYKLSATIQGVPAMFQFTCEPRDGVTDYRSLRMCDFMMFARLHWELMKHGVMLDEDNQEPIYNSFSHSKNDLRTTLQAFEKSVEHAKTLKSPLFRRAYTEIGSK